MTVPLPPGELARLSELRSYDILDTLAEQAYDDITHLASHLCGTPIALISFVDEDRQWFKSRVGLPVQETPRAHAFCAHALLHPADVMIVPDALLDQRFVDNPLVTGDPHIRFYAGAPLVTPDGNALGTMCVIDRQPRQLDAAQMEALRALSRLVIAQLELRRALRSSADLHSQQRRSEEALSAAQALQQATERRTRLIVDTALDAVVMIDREARVIFWNAQAEATFGWSGDEVIGQPLAELIIPPGLRDAHHAGMQRYLATGEARVLNQRIEVPAQDREGREFPVELTITPIREGDTLTFSAFIRDISARKRSEQLLETQYLVSQALGSAETLADVASQIISTTCRSMDWDFGALWLLDARTDALACANSWMQSGLEASGFAERTASMTFRSGEGLPGRVLEQGAPIWIPDVTKDTSFPRGPSAAEAGLVTGVALPVLAGGDVAGVIELFSRRKLPLDREVMNTLSSVASQLGQFVERKQAEQAMRLSEARTRAVVDNMLEGLMVVGADLRVLEANDAFARIFGYDRQALVGMPVVQLMPDTPDYQDEARLTAKYHQSLGRITEHEGRRQNGDIFPLELQVYEIVTPEGQLIAAHVRDLSQERESDRLKQQFVASVSHELRTPLTAIRGALGLLLQNAAGPLPDGAREMVNVAERNAVRLVSIIDDLLDFERLQLGLLSCNRELFPLDRAVERAVESVATMARESGITVVAPPANLVAFGDESRVIQVLVNLLSNAAKFAPPESRVNVSVERSGDFAIVRVRDEGRGVPAPMQEVIFEPFRQVEGSDARRHRGSGLGLAICRAIVRQHGGDIGMESPDTGGALFWFTLPLHDGHPAARPVAPAVL